MTKKYNLSSLKKSIYCIEMLSNICLSEQGIHIKICNISPGVNSIIASIDINGLHIDDREYPIQLFVDCEKIDKDKLSDKFTTKLYTLDVKYDRCIEKLAQAEIYEEGVYLHNIKTHILKLDNARTKMDEALSISDDEKYVTACIDNMTEAIENAESYIMFLLK